MSLHSIIAAVGTFGLWAIAAVAILLAAALLLLQVVKVGWLLWLLTTCWNKISRQDARALAVFLVYLFVVTPAYYAGLIWAIQPYVYKMGDVGTILLLLSPLAVVSWMAIATLSLLRPLPPEELGAGWEPPPSVNHFARPLGWAITIAVYGGTVWLATQRFPQWIGTASFFVLITVVPPALLPAIVLSLRRPAIGVAAPSESVGSRRPT